MSRTARMPFGGRQRGFTLLEAIVALTIFSISAMALYAWLAANVNALVRVDARSTAVRDGRAALAMLEPVNPMAEPAGSRELPGGLSVRWTSRQVDAQPGMGLAGNTLVFDLALYDLDVRLLRDGREEDRFTLRRAGWTTARQLPDADF
jgi:general secretion pathway protein I